MNDELTSRLSRQLHEQADHLPAAPLTLDDVRGRARSIRRTRRVVAGAAVAAVIAVVAPLGIVAGGVFDASPDRELPPAGPTEAVDPGPGELGIPYLEKGRRLVLPDGSEMELDRKYDDAVVLDGGQVFAISWDPDTGFYALHRMTEDGDAASSVEMADSRVAVSADRSAFAYVTVEGELRVAGANGEVSLGAQPEASPVALLGGPDCENDECVVYLERGGMGPVAVTGSGEVTELPGDPLNVEDASAAVDRVAMMTSIDEREPSSCSRVLSSDFSDEVFETCDYTLGRFSPTGSYLSAGPSYRSGHGDTVAAILDAETGEELARFEPEDGSITQTVWEDSEHLLALTHYFGAREWSVVRIGTDGTTEVALGPAAGGSENPPWTLLRPRG